MPISHGAAQRLPIHADARAALRDCAPSPWPLGQKAGGPTDLATDLFEPGLRNQAMGREAIGAIGRIVFTPDQQPIRTIITGRRRLVTGSYASRKARRGLPFEGMNEPTFFMHSEVDTNVVDYRAQPFRFEFVLDSRPRTYIVDCVRLLADGGIEVVEVKNDRRALRDPDYSHKLERVADICDALQWEFRVVLGEQLRLPRVRFANIVQVQSDRHARFDASHCHVAFDLLDAAGGEMPLGRLAEALAGRQRGTAIAQAMMVGRLLQIDLDAPLGPNSAVRAAASAASSFATKEVL